MDPFSDGIQEIQLIIYTVSEYHDSNSWLISPSVCWGRVEWSFESKAYTAQYLVSTEFLQQLSAEMIEMVGEPQQ